MMMCMTQLPAHNPEDAPGLLTAAEVGQLLDGLSAETVNRWARDGKLPCITLPSGHRRFRRKDVDAILAGTPVTAEIGAS
jgi:excisionase family DNA binding protein